MTRPPRKTQPRRWTSLALASVTLAAAPAWAQSPQPAPVTLAMPESRLWLASAEGGEGGEAGLTAEATPDAAYLAELMIVEGHMRAARDLYALDQQDMAVDLAGHPQEEGTLDKLSQAIEARHAPQVAPAIDGFRAVMGRGAPLAEVDAALATVSAAFAAAAAPEADETRARFDAVVLLVKAAAEEYEGSLAEGEVAEPMGWHESLSFVGLARQALQDLASQPLAAKAAPKALAALEPADALFGDVTAADPVAGDPQILLGLAAKVELIASSVR